MSDCQYFVFREPEMTPNGLSVIVDAKTVWDAIDTGVELFVFIIDGRRYEVDTQFVVTAPATGDGNSYLVPKSVLLYGFHDA